jgi:hypothetical protein
MADMRGPYTPGKSKKSDMDKEYDVSAAYLKVFKRDKNFKNVEAGRKMEAKVNALGTMRKLLKGKKGK